MEIWKDIPGYEGRYQVSDAGSVFSVRSSRLLTPYRNVARGGYRYVNLHVNGVQSMRRVAGLVLLAFVGPRPTDHEVCHNDGSVDNDALSNLRYDTRKANQADRRAHGTHLAGEKHPAARLSDADVLCIRTSPENRNVLASRYGVTAKHIDSIRTGRRRG